MPKKKSTAIVPLFSNQKQGLLVLKAGLEIGPTPNEQAQDVYKSDYVLQLEEEIKSLSHAKEQIKYLKVFRDLLSGPPQQLSTVQNHGSPGNANMKNVKPGSPGNPYSYNQPIPH